MVRPSLKSLSAVNVINIVNAVGACMRAMTRRPATRGQSARAAGLVREGGRRSRRLGRWAEAEQPDPRGPWLRDGSVLNVHDATGLRLPDALQAPADRDDRVHQLTTHRLAVAASVDMRAVPARSLDSRGGGVSVTSQP